MRIQSRFTRWSPLVFGLALGCAEGTDTGEDVAPADTAAAEAPAAPAPAGAIARLSPTEGNQVTGTVEFTPAAGGVRVRANVTGLSEGLHGFHVHEFGDCSAPDGSSAGGHFAPEGSQHGGPDQRPPDAHVGDFGNLEADASGAARYDRTFEDVALEGEGSIDGKAVIVHQGEDDLETDPAGDAGPRVACGVIERGGSPGS